VREFVELDGIFFFGGLADWTTVPGIVDSSIVCVIGG
jgi:hypothetical protein